ncbi:MAG: hypothetical protein AB8G22_08965 [Saprospiraceae bacterium]
MKQAATIFLLFLVSAIALRDAAIYLYWKYNQSALTETECVNINKPELTCFARCYLTQQLVEANEDTPDSNQLLEVEEQRVDLMTNELVYLPKSIISTTPELRSQYSDPVVSTINHSIFHPPQQA